MSAPAARPANGPAEQDPPRDGRVGGSPSAVVIGGGISGLATAALLARDGYEVDLVEARTQLGGRAGSWEHGGFRFDTGPSWYLMPEVFDHFFRLLGTSAAEQLDLHGLDPGYRVFFEEHDEPIDIRASAARNATAFEAIEPGAGRRLDEYLDSASRTYEMALEHFLYSSFTRRRELLAAPILAQAPRLLQLLLEPLERFVGRRFADPRLRQILGYPAVFLGSSPDRTPSMYHLMSAMDLTGGVLYPQGGFARLIDVIVALAEQEGVRLHTATRATRILTAPQPGQRRPRAVGVEVQGADGPARTLAADVVVATADLHHVETTMLPPALQTYPERWWEKATSGPGAVLVLLGVEGELPQLSHHSLFFTRDWGANFGAIRKGSVPSPASLYVCRPSATDPSVAPAGHENLFVLVPMPADPGLGSGRIDGAGVDGDDGAGGDGAGSPAVEAIADEAIAQIADWAGIPDLAGRVVVRRTIGPAEFATDLRTWKGGMLGPAHTLRQSAFLRAGNASRKVDSLLYAGSSTIPGIGLPMCLISAELIVKRLREDSSASPMPEPTPRKEPAGRSEPSGPRDEAVA